MKRRKKVTENIVEKRNLQERMEKWLKLGGQITLGGKIENKKETMLKKRKEKPA